MERFKYPRTPHLPWSAGVTRDDRVIASLDELNSRELIVTEKLDGSNICFTKEVVFSRGGNATHASFDWLKGWHAGIRNLLIKDVYYYAEYCYAVHSITYLGLDHYVNLFAVRSEYDSGMGDVWWPWEDIVRYSATLDIPTVPVIGAYRANSIEQLKKDSEFITKEQSFYKGPREGFVVRYPGYIRIDQFDTHVAKWVREGHVQTDDHWMHQAIVKQSLRDKL
jgi:hypothetical protein